MTIVMFPGLKYEAAGSNGYDKLWVTIRVLRHSRVGTN
jgi:hypothetical protein